MYVQVSASLPVAPKETLPSLSALLEEEVAVPEGNTALGMPRSTPIKSKRSHAHLSSTPTKPLATAVASTGGHPQSPNSRRSPPAKRVHNLHGGCSSQVSSQVQGEGLLKHAIQQAPTLLGKSMKGFQMKSCCCGDVLCGTVMQLYRTVSHAACSYSVLNFKKEGKADAFEKALRVNFGDREVTRDVNIARIHYPRATMRLSRGGYIIIDPGRADGQEFARRSETDKTRNSKDPYWNVPDQSPEQAFKTLMVLLDGQVRPLSYVTGEVNKFVVKVNAVAKQCGLQLSTTLSDKLACCTRASPSRVSALESPKSPESPHHILIGTTDLSTSLMKNKAFKAARQRFLVIELLERLQVHLKN